MTESIGSGNVLHTPSVAVSMPAHNAARFIGAAIESLLAQQDVELDLVVVDDGSTDGTGDIAARYADRGVRVLRNVERRGIGFCHNRVIHETSAPLIAHVDADDTVLPGSLNKLARAALGDERVGQAYCDSYPVNAAGIVASATIEQCRNFFARHRAPPIDYARELVVHGMIVNCLRTYRRSVFDVVGGFDETLPWAVDYEMALRIAEHFTFARVPEMLYARRQHRGGVTQALRAKAWRFWWMRSKLVRRQLRRQGGTLLGRGVVSTNALLLLALAYTLRDLITPASTD